MERMVKCPLCGKIRRTKGKHYFRCCQMAWDIEKCRTTYDDSRYTKVGEIEAEIFEEVEDEGIEEIEEGKKNGAILIRKEDLKKLWG